MRRTLKLFVVASLASIALLACKSSDKKKSEEENAAATKSGQRSKTGFSLDCDKLIPRSTREKFFPQFSVRKRSLCPGCSDVCEAGDPQDVSLVSGKGIRIMYDCRRRFSSTEIQKTKDQMIKLGYAEIPGIGRSALKRQLQLTFWDEDTNCYVAINGAPSQGTIEDLARDIEKDLTSESLGK
jgi:hypothetical protein